MSESSNDSEPLLRKSPSPMSEGTSSPSSEKDSSNSPNYEAIQQGTEMQDKIIKVIGESREDSGATNWWALFMTVLSGVLFTGSNALVKDLDSISTMELLALRSLVQITVMLAIIAYLAENPLGPPGLRFFIILQGVFGGISLVLLFIAYRRLPIGDTTAIIYCYPVIVLVLSYLFLGEECKFLHNLIACMLLTGIVLISQPPFIFYANQHDIGYDGWGYAAAVLCAFFTALNIVLVRKCKDVHFSVLVLHFSLWSFKFAVGLVLFHGSLVISGGSLIDADMQQWILAAVIAVAGLVGMILLVRALNLESAGKVSIVRTLEIVMAFILQIAYWGEMPDWMKSLGAALVCICVAAVGTDQQISRAAAIIP